MIYVGLTKGIINATAHWYLAVTEDGTTFKNEDKDTLKEVLKCVEEMQKDTLKEVAICFDHWGASILESESGTSLKAAGWKCVGKAGGERWTGKRRPEVDLYPAQFKLRFEVESGG